MTERQPIFNPQHFDIIERQRRIAAGESVPEGAMLALEDRLLAFCCTTEPLTAGLVSYLLTEATNRLLAQRAEKDMHNGKPATLTKWAPTFRSLTIVPNAPPQPVSARKAPWTSALLARFNAWKAY